jgi:hypothetical protein
MLKYYNTLKTISVLIQTEFAKKGCVSTRYTTDNGNEFELEITLENEDGDDMYSICPIFWHSNGFEVIHSLRQSRFWTGRIDGILLDCLYIMESSESYVR